jgi:hypothetical protein
MGNCAINRTANIGVDLPCMQVFFTFSRGKSREMPCLSPGRTAWERRTAFLPVNGMVAGYAARGAAEGGKSDAGHMKMHSGII